MLESRDFLDANETLEGITAMHDAFSFIDQIGVYCYYAVQDDVGIDTFTYQIKNPTEILINLAYNVGFMFTDVINFIYYTPATVP